MYWQTMASGKVQQGNSAKNEKHVPALQQIDKERPRSNRGEQWFLTFLVSWSPFRIWLKAMGPFNKTT